MKVIPYQRGSKRPAESVRRAHISRLQYRLWQAEFIGWPALAESFRRDLVALGVKT